MTQNAPPSAADSERIFKTNSAPSTENEEEKKQTTSPRMSNPATKAGVDPLAGVMPCFGESCDAPRGDFENRAKLESLLKRSESEAGAKDSSGGGLTDAIREAVDIAIVSFIFLSPSEHPAFAWVARLGYMYCFFT